MVGPLLIVLCGTCSLLGVLAPIFSVLRHGKRGLLIACLGLVGAIMVPGLAMLYIGLIEGTWTIGSVAAWAAMVVGGSGLVLIVIATRSAWRARLGPGLCPKCEYDLKGLSQCPECGRRAGVRS